MLSNRPSIASTGSAPEEEDAGCAPSSDEEDKDEWQTIKEDRKSCKEALVVEKAEDQIIHQ